MKELMAYTGLAPSEYSGGRTIQRDLVTETGIYKTFQKYRAFISHLRYLIPVLYDVQRPAFNDNRSLRNFFSLIFAQGYITN
jgi:hypothetical protein